MAQLNPLNSATKRALATRYAESHLQADAKIHEVHYLPDGAPDREIRLVEVKEPASGRDEDALESFHARSDKDCNDHTVRVEDVSVSQWSKIKNGNHAPPNNWGLEGMELVARRK